MSSPFFGFHYDIARGTYPTREVLQRALRLAGESGYTHFLPYLENMIRLPSMERACPKSAYTAEDWATFEAVAHEAGIELVPHFNVIGHSEKLSPSYPEFCGQPHGNGHREIDPENPAARAWMLRCLQEFCDISHSEYFLIGGDEWQPTRAQLARPGFDAARTWVDQVNAAVELLVARGRKPIVWHDMLIHHPDACTLLSQHAVIAYWYYDTDSDYPALSYFQALGFQTLMASSVFDGSLPILTRRSVDALQKASAAAKLHHCAGMIVTSWETCRWEWESFNIAKSAEIVLGGNSPIAVVNALTLLGAWLKLPADCAQIAPWRARLLAALDAHEWDAAPEMRRVVRAILCDDHVENVASYLQFHQPEGEGYERARSGEARSNANAVSANIPIPESTFGITVRSDEERGDVVQFCNGDESFVIYPKYGATMQSWQKAGTVVIPDMLESFLKREMLPGGYRSYVAAGGFRPIWAMITHSNPCILWQYPWGWRIVEEADSVAGVEFTLSLPHGEFVLRYEIQAGRSGWICEARAVNRLPGIQATWNFNMILPADPHDLDKTFLEWAGGRTTLAEKGQTVWWVDATEGVSVDWVVGRVEIKCEHEKTAGFFVDWFLPYVTPDLHGVYHQLAAGNELSARWSFTVSNAPPETR